MYALEIRDKLKEKFHKMAKKDRQQLEAINKKIFQIRKNPHMFKPLKVPMAGMRRVHFGSYVLLFSIDEARKTVVLEDYEHHDKIYRK